MPRLFLFGVFWGSYAVLFSSAIKGPPLSPRVHAAQVRLKANSTAKFNVEIPLNSTTAIVLERYAKPPAAATPTSKRGCYSFGRPWAAAKLGMWDVAPGCLRQATGVLGMSAVPAWRLLHAP